MKMVFLLLVLLASRSTVVFTVVDSDGNPIEGAEIRFCGYQEVTDAEGKAVFKNIPQPENTIGGACGLEIFKEGYLPVTDAFGVTEDMEKTYILYSNVMTTVSGTVYYDRSDNPAPFVSVRVYDAKTDQALFSVLTNEQGEFSFEISEDRSIYVVVSDYDDQKVYLSLEENQIVIVNTKGVYSAVEVTVRTTTGKVLEGVLITLEGADAYKTTRKTNEKGLVLFSKVANGDYVLTAEIPGYSTVTKEISVISRERDSVFQVSVTMEVATGQLKVNVTTESGEPLLATVTITGEETVVVQVQQETFDVIPGMYTVEVKSPGYKAVEKQVEILEGEITSLEFTLEKSERTVKVESKAFPWEIVMVMVVAAAGVIIIYLKKR
jgi:hypothetical protein